MRVYANGKNISAHPLSNVLVQGERYADTVEFVLERTYEGVELEKCTFAVRGVNSEGKECQQVLPSSSEGENIVVVWNINEYFTAAAGELELELRAGYTTENGEEGVLKFRMAPVTVAPSPSGSEGVVPDVAEQLLNEINNAVSEGVQEIQQTIDSFDTSAIEERLDTMDSNIGIFLSRPEVIPVTREQYNSIPHKKNALYVIVKEVTV